MCAISFFSQVEFEPHNNRTGTIREFLTWFDAIFTLNQDMLLDQAGGCTST